MSFLIEIWIVIFRYFQKEELDTEQIEAVPIVEQLLQRP